MASPHHGGGCQVTPWADRARKSGGLGRGEEANPGGAAPLENGGGRHYDHHRTNGLGAEEGRGGGGGYEECSNGVGDHHGGGGGGGAGYDFGGDDLHQAGPPLADDDDAAAALLRKEFGALGVQVRAAGPVLPPRRGYGSEGRPCVVKANRFLARIVDGGLHHYEVSILPDPKAKGVCREVMSKLVSEHLDIELGGHVPAYDGGDSLFTAGALPFDTMEFDVTLSAGDGKRKGRKYKVVIKHAAAISLLQLRMLLAGYPTDIPVEALQVLDIVMRDVVFSKRNDNENFANGGSFSQKFELGDEAWKGLYQSIRSTQDSLSLVVDVSSTVFVEPLLLIDFVHKILKIDTLDRNLTKPEYAKLLKALSGVRIEVTHRGAMHRKYRVVGLSSKATKDLSFESAPGATKTVVDYFRETYNLELKYKFLPCLQVSSDHKPVYLPIEVCKIVPRQRYQKKLEGSQFSTVVELNQYNSNKLSNLAKVDARVLPPPNLKYHDSGSQKTWFPRNGYWNMKDKKVENGVQINNWACINFCEDLSNRIVEQFCSKLAERARTIGVDLSDLKLPIFTARPDQVEDDLHLCYREAQNELRDKKIGLLLAILPDDNGSLYGNVKRICETDIGLVSQCYLRSNVFTENNQILANIAIKINAKAGGRHSVFDDVQKSLPVVSNKPTIIFGADVNHPNTIDDSAPSIASVVASQGWDEVSKYNGVVRAQGHHEGLIDGLENTVKELLCAFEKESEKKPRQLIFYRDGVSESQFKQLLEKEIPEIEKAWKALYDNEKPQITFIVVQKRQHHSLSLSRNKKKSKRYVANRRTVEPGTVIDREICRPTEFDFFLCSHAGSKGKSHPVQYLVLRDDNNFTADELQSLTNNLCYIYASCTCAVSVAPPAYYAHKLATRARYYLTTGPDGGAAAPAGGTKQIPEIKDELKKFMFYC